MNSRYVERGLVLLAVVVIAALIFRQAYEIRAGAERETAHFAQLDDRLTQLRSRFDDLETKPSEPASDEAAVPEPAAETIEPFAGF